MTELERIEIWQQKLAAIKDFKLSSKTDEAIKRAEELIKQRKALLFPYLNK